MVVSYEKQFEKALKKLPSKIKDKFFVRLNIFIEDRFNRILNNHIS